MQNDNQQHIWIPEAAKWPSQYADQLQLFPFQDCPVSDHYVEFCDAFNQSRLEIFLK